MAAERLPSPISRSARCVSCARALAKLWTDAPASQGRVLLGGDYLVENDPAWACSACGLQWRAWPWAAGGAVEECPPAARVAGAGAGAGVHFAAEV
jgi:hypothetical protein